MEKEVWYRAEESTTGTGYTDECGDWHRTGDSSVSIIIRELEVLKHTPKGVWLKEHSQFSDRRFVLNESRKRFACATIKEALDSFVARKERQAGIYEARARTARRAIRLAQTGTVASQPTFGMHRITEDFGFHIDTQAELLRNRDNALRKLNEVVDAWEALPGGRNYSVSTVQSWLSHDMTNAVNKVRRFLGRPKPEPAS